MNSEQKTTGRKLETEIIKKTPHIKNYKLNEVPEGIMTLISTSWWVEALDFMSSEDIKQGERGKYKGL